MQEYIANAIVLSRRPAGEADSSITLYTKELGKVRARAKSIRKITSKLAAHLTVGAFAIVRLVRGSGGFQIVDALKKKAGKHPPSLLALLVELLPEQDANAQLWDLLTAAPPFPWKDVLALAGWDPAHARCASCGQGKPRFFFIRQTCFLCTRCAQHHRIATTPTSDSAAIHLQAAEIKV